MTAFDDDLRLAHVLADSADAITMGRFKARDLKVESKPDMTPVSDADKAAEEAIRSALSRARPRDAMLGEEFGETAAGATGRKWIIDPIDGTKNYVRGVPVWATLIGLMEGEEVVAGVVSAPALGRRWWAAKGGGAFTGRSLSSAQRCQVSKVAAIARRLARLLLGRRRGRSTASWTPSWTCPGPAGGPAPTATSGRTCWSPRARWTWPRSRSCRCGTWRRWR